MFSKEYLYINAIKFRSQLKVNFKRLANNNIVETNSSTFIAKDDIMGRDIATKLVALQSQIDNTYISTLLLHEDVKLLKKGLPRPKDHQLRVLNSDYNIAVSKNALFETRNYFTKCGIDYVFSAYHILNLHIQKHPCNNNLEILLFNNQAFCVILNANGEIVFNKKVDLTAFEDIKGSQFYENELMGQKLFDEVYALEVFELIKKTIEEFYLFSKNIFIEKVSIVYNLKLISDEQISKMGEDLMMGISYHPISVDEELFELSKDIHTQKSFIKPRKKPNNRLKNGLIISLIIVLLIAIAYLFYPKVEQLLNKKEQKVQTAQKVEGLKEVKISVNLQNHIQSNNIIKDRILNAFNSIPYDMVLNELTIDENSLKMQLNLLNKDSYIKVLQPELKKIYNDLNITFIETKSPILNAIIEAKGIIKKEFIKPKDYKNVYAKNEFMPIIKITEKMKSLFPNSTIIFKNSITSDVITFEYLVDIVMKNPAEFFQIIDRLNKEPYAINISYPINFVKTEAGVKVEFKVQFIQPK